MLCSPENRAQKMQYTPAVDNETKPEVPRPPPYSRECQSTQRQRQRRRRLLTRKSRWQLQELCHSRSPPDRWRARRRCTAADIIQFLVLLNLHLCAARALDDGDTTNTRRRGRAAALRGRNVLVLQCRVKRVRNREPCEGRTANHHSTACSNSLQRSHYCAGGCC